MNKIEIKQSPKIISCFPGIGKNFAIEKLKEAGYKVYSIEKKDKSFNKSMLLTDLISLRFEYDIIFIPFYIGMHNDLNKYSMLLTGLPPINPIIVYPNKNCLEIYLSLYKELNFSQEEIQYISDNWDEMMKYIQTCGLKRIEINPNDDNAPHYLLDVLSY